MALDLEYATSQLNAYVEWNAEPSLTDEQQDSLLSSARAVDVNNVAPGGVGYIETYTYNSIATAIALGAGMKKTKAAELHEGDESKIFDHWVEIEADWLRRIGYSAVGPLEPSSYSQSVAHTVAW